MQSTDGRHQGDAARDGAEHAAQHAAPDGARHDARHGGRHDARRRRGRWRVGTPLVVLACGVLCVVSAQSSDGTDLRPGRYDDLATLTQAEANHAAGLQDQVAQLNRQVSDLTDRVDDDTVRTYQRRVHRLEEPAGLTARHGAGVTVTLSDAPADLIEQTSDKVPLVVHQQDIQAVVNALWQGGATAVTVQGQRVISTTGIKCEGSSVVLQGVPYPQPYVISALGDVDGLTGALADDSYLRLYRQQSADPAIDVGWRLATSADLRVPAYDGVLGLSYAAPVSSPAAP